MNAEAALLALAILTTLTTGWDAFRDRVCSDGDYPVWSVRAPETGGTCVTEGKKPPPGYATYPPGLVPEYVEDTVVCPDGKCVDGPLAINCPHTYPADPCRIAGRELHQPAPDAR